MSFYESVHIDLEFLKSKPCEFTGPLNKALTGIVRLDFVSPNIICHGFNNSSCWAQSNNQLYIVLTYAKSLYQKSS